MNKIVPLADIPSQKFQIQLNNQNCTFEVYQKSTGLFLNLYINDILLRGGVICEDRTRLIRDSYLGFVGDLMFLDQQGTLDPRTPGLGTRFILCYLDQ